jgi:site-specific DNA recombinase
MKKRTLIYTRVSTDEQNNGYSPADQKDKLISFCENHDVEVMGIYHDDESGKSFNRPEWIKIMAYLKANKGVIDYIYFLKWDRFSRNASEAYAEIAKLNKLGVEAVAIEQQLNLEIPENKMLLAIYLTTPEIDNDRRSLNIFNGIRRAKKEGRWIGPRPLGYKNARDQFNKPIIIPEGGIQETLIKKAFADFSTGLYSSEELRKKYNKLGLKTSKNGIWNILRNKAYIGKIYVPTYKNEPGQWVEGLHEALIDIDIFEACQDVIEGRKRKVPATFKTIREEFPLRGYLICPQCNRMLTASSSKGRNRYYQYYHCTKDCNERHKADEINKSFEYLLNELTLDKNAILLLCELLKKKYKDQNRSTRLEAESIQKEISKQETRLNNIRILFVDGEIIADEYRQLKSETEQTLTRLRLEHVKASTEVINIDDKLDKLAHTLSNLKELYKQGDTLTKRKIIGSMFPKNLTYEKNSVRTIEINLAVALITSKIKPSTKGKKEKHTDFGMLSHRVESEGFEPSSKQ